MIKKNVAAWKSGDNSMQPGGGDAVMSMLYSSRAVPPAKSASSTSWNGAIRDTGNLAVLKGV
jgi:hypothetical protein